MTNQLITTPANADDAPWGHEYRPASGYRCKNGELKVPAYLSQDQLNQLNEYAKSNGLSFKDGISQIVSLGLGEV